jgi:hypothetical protein
LFNELFFGNDLDCKGQIIIECTICQKNSSKASTSYFFN